MQLEVKPYEKAQPIEWNFDELKTELAKKVEDYKTLQYTPEQMAAAKTDRASLNNLKKALQEERIRREKEFMEPFQLFKSQVNELIAMIDVPAKLIDDQVKEFEAYEKRQKREECVKIWENMMDDGAIPDWLKFEQIENEKWQNKTFTIAKVTDEIEERISRIKADIELITALPDFAFEAMECYKKSLNASAALAEGRSLAELARRKAEAEERRKAEIARVTEQANTIAQAAQETATATMVEEMPTENEKAENKPNTAKKMVLCFRCEVDANQARALRECCDKNGIILTRI